MGIEETLEKIGLDKKEAKVYLAVLALGETTVLPIAQRADIQRTYCYDILDSLAKKGFVSFMEKRGRRRYSGLEPKMIKDLLIRKISQVEMVLPALQALYQQTPTRPKVRFFEGREGIEIIHQEILREAKEVWFVGSIEDWAKRFPDYINYVKEQVSRGIKIRDLVKPKDKDALKYQHLYKKPRQEMRFLPEAVNFVTDNMLWNNKLAMVSYGADLYAIVIESTEISQTMRAIYETLWLAANK
ncbi:MAG: transcriptional regulator TrmB [Candidatus Berkelbacteria bacterium Licking1014_2]|uniref:Transcriptional regulator TrmB n=1 Tax=Candidatus Berkelbacteria bacterium Licking1014_2 TaxID=2017146 RepID=A0A554LUG5_9BACT|nr:MAG: transcriptional regulator TrmB [Candidatus Berkelbacteria bacterium Licking1014_2]